MTKVAAPIGRLTQNTKDQLTCSMTKAPNVGPMTAATPYIPGDVALHPRPLDRRIDVADNRRGDRLDGARADPLNRPEQDQRPHVPGAAAQQGAEQKHTCAGKEHPLAAVEVGKAPIDRDRHRLGQQKCGKCPAEQAKPAEVGDDRGHRGGDDIAVRRHHEDRQHDPGHDEPAGGPGFGALVRQKFPGGGLIEQNAPD